MAKSLVLLRNLMKPTALKMSFVKRVSNSFFCCTVLKNQLLLWTNADFNVLIVLWQGKKLRWNCKRCLQLQMRANNTSYVYIIKFNSGEEENWIPRNGGGNLRNSGFSLCLCSTRLPPPQELLQIISWTCSKGCSNRCSCKRAGLPRSDIFVYIVPAWDAAIKQKHWSRRKQRMNLN